VHGIRLGHWVFLHDTEPSKIIRHARHAVSIDENRIDFDPTLWSDKPGLDLKQVWFSGVHSDIGGGYDESGLSQIASKWVFEQATACGLIFEPHFINSLNPNPLDKLHNERKGIYRARKASVRKITGPLHASVKERWDIDINGYRKRSKALAQLLGTVNDYWSKIRFES